MSSARQAAQGVSKIATVFRNTTWMTFDLALELLLPLVTSVLVARVMGPTYLGAYAYVVWISQMAIAVGSLGVPTAVSRYLPEALAKRQADVAWAIVRDALRLQVVTTVVIVLVGLMLVAAFTNPEERVFASLAVLSIFPAGVLGIATAIHSSFEDVGSNVIPSIAGSLVNVGIVIATLLLRWDLPGLASALLFGRLADAGLRWYLVARNGPGHLRERGITLDGLSRGRPVPADLRKELVTFCVQSSVLLALDLAVWNRSEMFFLKRWCKIQEVAYFSLAFSLGLMPGHLAQPFINAAATSLFAEQGKGEAWLQRFAGVMWRYTALLVWPAALGLAAVGGPLVRILYGPRYAAAIPAVVIAAVLSGLPRLVASPTRLVTVLGGQGRLVSWGIASAVLGLALDVVLVRPFCATGGAVANGVAQTVATLGVCLIAVRGYGFTIDWRFNARVCAAAAAMALAVAVFASKAPDVIALGIGPILGVVLYALAVRAFKVLDATDAERLGTLERALPLSARRPYRWVAACCGVSVGPH